MNQYAAVPRPEYPRPQFVRDEWLCLNGIWQFEIDSSDSGLENGWKDRDLASSIAVPFCPESELSGIHRTEFLHAVWYRRTVSIPAQWAGRRVLLHFQACDYDTTVWIDGIEAVRHRGGFTPFAADLGVAPEGGKDVTIVVRARDPHKSPMPFGKQSEKLENEGCHYTRTTGIWQTVWLEPVPIVHLKRPRITPDLASASFMLEFRLSESHPGYQVRAAVGAGSRVLATATASAASAISPRLTLIIPEGDVRPWSIDDPHLYEITIDLLEPAGRSIDTIKSYGGLRSITIDGKAIKLNGKTVFQRLVLDQGFYRDGIMTAPTDAALKRDIELSQAAGFNGARLHQKVFEERFLYWADRLGYLVWGEFPDWGASIRTGASDYQQPTPTFLTQWLEAIERDYSHPSIVGWCPLNETHQPIADRITVLDDVTRALFLATKAIDVTRPVLDASGYSHRVFETDVYDSHDYDQNPKTFAERHAHIDAGKPFINKGAKDEKAGRESEFSLPYRGQPYFVSEFGGIWWSPGATLGKDSWGYGDRPKDVEEFFYRLEGLTSALLNNPAHFGYCYTQLTDVFQEQNGIYTFERGTKVDMARVRAAQTKRAAIEGLT
jgi:beta-galactosidase/beta-glucuronidase